MLFRNKEDRILIKKYINARKILFKNKERYSKFEFEAAVRYIDESIMSLKERKKHDKKKKSN